MSWRGEHISDMLSSQFSNLGPGVFPSFNTPTSTWEGLIINCVNDWSRNNTKTCKTESTLELLMNY